MRTNIIFGECAKHPGNNMVGCVLCKTENIIKTDMTIGDKKIPTAEELANSRLSYMLSRFTKEDKDEFYFMMREFAKIHVKEALESAFNNLNWENCYDGGTHCHIDRHEINIIKSYSDENIK